MCNLSPSSVFTSSAFSHDHPILLRTLSTLAADPSVPGLTLLFCMAPHACLHSGIHVPLLLSTVFSVVSICYTQTCAGSVLRPLTSTASRISFDLMFAPVGQRVRIISEMSAPWDCSLGIPRSVANWYLGIAFVSMSRARASKPKPLGRRAILATVRVASSVLLFSFVLSVAFVGDWITNLFLETHDLHPKLLRGLLHFLLHLLCRCCTG